MKDKIRAVASFNALGHEGKAELNSVISKTVSLFPEERKNLKTLMPLIKEIVDEVNSLSAEEMKAIIERYFPELLATTSKEEEKRLPDLPGVVVPPVKKSRHIQHFVDSVTHLHHPNIDVLGRERVIGYFR